MTDYAGRHIWIIGASSGIGRAVAIELARRGARLVLSARNGAKLDDLRRQIGDSHMAIPLDITDSIALVAAFDRAQEALPQMDSVLMFAGSYERMSLDALDLTACRAIVDTNLMGALNVIHATLPYLRERQGAQIGLCASVAGYRGLPHGQPYSATKAALINLAESLKAETRGTRLDVKLINPGFVRTGMTDKNRFAMPAMIEPEQAAKHIADGLLSKTFEIHFPKRFTLFMKLLRILPAWIYFKVVPK